jgi:hypothetical protein
LKSVERGGEEILTTEDTEGTEEAEACLDKPSGDAFSNPSPSELARDSENSLLTRSARGPAGAAGPPRTDGEGLLAGPSGVARELHGAQ